MGNDLTSVSDSASVSTVPGSYIFRTIRTVGDIFIKYDSFEVTTTVPGGINFAVVTIMRLMFSEGFSVASLLFIVSKLK